MQAIEFEAIADQHMLRLPDQVPDGVKLRVLLLLDDIMPETSEPQPESRSRRQPSPKLAGSVIMHDNLLAPAVPEKDWNALK
ncbi:MAG TPA: hypothetical protein P5149_01140 [Candidatus Competibacteraceae bacterium]|nr:hypothetical protein [Candidatus Competibacteraceae bacterium]MCP5132595.1 hypothetical protein [Gammaproteobacteria bacterium]HPF57634.1 hypothetical protein [Candidatus Competibacteraceae bacterium]HRF44081.1 hypothetical protein [Candidatus Competibacteraceae bacterium]HRY16982.1 hypothetical protein [Candidatus Competibacteraceae bacterium]